MIRVLGRCGAPHRRSGQLRSITTPYSPHTTRITVTPATLVTELLRLFPPASLSAVGASFDWDSLFLVRVQEVAGQPRWTRTTPVAAAATSASTRTAANSCGFVNARSGLWHPRGSVAPHTTWHRAHTDPAMCDRNCVVEMRLSQTKGDGDAVRDVWQHALSYMYPQPVSSQGQPQLDTVYAWGSSAVYAIYHYSPHGPSKVLLRLPRCVGTYYAIPGLPQPPPNVTSSLTGKKTDLHVQGTVLSLQTYLSFLVPSYRAGMESGPAVPVDANTNQDGASAYLFDPPRHHDRSTTTRGRIANRQMFWQCVPLISYLKALPRGTLAHRDDSVLLQQRGIAVLVLLEHRVWYFSLLMTPHNPFLPHKADSDASFTASVCFAFIHAPTEETIPARLCESFALPSPLPACGAGANDAANVSALVAALPTLATVLVHDQEEKQYRLPYHPRNATHTPQDKATARAAPSVSRYTVQWCGQQDERERAQESLLALFLSRPSRVRVNRGVSHNCPVVFSPFPPPSKLLRNSSVFEKPEALAEEMRYGLLIRYGT